MEWADHGFMGVRTAAGLYMFIHGHKDTVVVEYHDYTGEADGEQMEAAWRSWLGRTSA